MEQEQRQTYAKDTARKLREKFAYTFGIPIDQVWIDAICASQCEEGKRLAIHPLKFTLSFPDTQHIGLITRLSIAEFDWSIFHTCSLDYSKHSQTVQLEFQLNHEDCKQILAKC